MHPYPYFGNFFKYLAVLGYKHFRQRQEQLDIQGSTSDAKSVRCAKLCPVPNKSNNALLLYINFEMQLLKLIPCHAEATLQRRSL